MALRPAGKGNMDDYIRFMESTLKSGYTDVKGALIFTKGEYFLDDKMTIKVLKEFAKRHPEKFKKN